MLDEIGIPIVLAFAAAHHAGNEKASKGIWSFLGHKPGESAGFDFLAIAMIEASSFSTSARTSGSRSLRWKRVVLSY
jgi:hypothetical protein